MARTADPHAKSALMLAARREFVRAGLLGARIEDITQASGLSKGAFYLHFDSKEALFAELVELFEQKMEAIIAERERAVSACRGQRAARLPALAALEAKYDREVLEHLWTERDVFAVLSHGAQGTPFEGFIWQLAQREVKRVVTSIESMKTTGACRRDVPSEVFGSLVVGSYLLIAQQMSRLERKPDLDRWIQATQQLIREGVAPRGVVRRKKRATRAPAVERRAS